MTVKEATFISINQRQQKSHENVRSLYGSACHSEQQSIVAWIAWLRTIRLDDLLIQMREIDYRKSNAMEELDKLVESVQRLIDTNRGGVKGIHGFIGERAQVFLSNARALLNGTVKICELIDDNGMTDYLENGIPIQQKACHAGGLLGLDHILNHKMRYPEFYGIYHIPKDFYATFRRLEKLSQHEAGRLSRHEWRQWLEIQEIKKAGIKIRPMHCTYDEIQKDAIFTTIEQERADMLADAEAQTVEAIQTHQPTLKECATVTATSAAVEGALSAGAEVLKKRFDGKHLKDYDREDIKDVVNAGLTGAGKGAVRGAVVYGVTNYTKVPGYVAGAAVSVAFESVPQVCRYVKGEITGQDCATAIGKSVATATGGAIGARIGRKLIPIPVVGDMIGGFVGTWLVDKGYGWLSRHWEVTTLRLSSPCVA